MATEWDDIRCQLAWAAGFFDGEGSTGTWPNKNRPGAINLFANVTQQSASSDEIPAVLTRFRVAVRGLGRISAPTPDLRSGTYLCQWRTHSFEEVQAVVALLWQDLGPVKRAQAARSLRAYHAQFSQIRARHRRPARTRRADLPAAVHPVEKTRTELAWAAGLFDGEGSTETQRRRRGAQAWSGLRSKVSQCDADGVPAVLSRFRVAVGVGWIEGPQSGNGYANAYKWAAGGADTLCALELLWPYLGAVKRDQALDAVSRLDARELIRRYRWRAAAYEFADRHRRLGEPLVRYAWETSAV